MLVREDGTGSNPAANSFEDVTGADLYFLGRTPPGWAALGDTEKQARLILGTRRIVNIYADRWPGVIANLNQPLPFPRLGCYDNAGRLVLGVPDCVRFAACEMAADAERVDPTVGLDRGGLLSSVSLGGELSVSWESGAPGGAANNYHRELLIPLLGPVGQLVWA